MTDRFLFPDPNQNWHRDVRSRSGRCLVIGGQAQNFCRHGRL